MGGRRAGPEPRSRAGRWQLSVPSGIGPAGPVVPGRFRGRAGLCGGCSPRARPRPDPQAPPQRSAPRAGGRSGRGRPGPEPRAPLGPYVTDFEFLHPGTCEMGGGSALVAALSPHSLQARGRGLPCLWSPGSLSGSGSCACPPTSVSSLAPVF